MLYEVITSPDFPPYMLNLLQQKYGRGKSESNMIQKILVWHPERDSEVRYLSSPGSLVVSYTDKKIAAFAAELNKATHDLPKQPLNRITSYNVCYTKLLRRGFGCWVACS